MTKAHRSVSRRSRARQRGKAAVYGLAAVGALGAVAGGVQLATGGSASDAFDETEICIKTNASLVDGLEPGCYARGALKAYLEKPVLGRAAAPVAVSLADPRDDLAPLAVVRTCGAYADLTRKKWYVLSSREMRREAFFVRACGALDMMIRSRPAETSHFADEEMSADDMRALASKAPFRIAESADAPAPGDGMAIENERPGWWRMRLGDQTALLQEIAHADFNKDGVGDILAFAFVGVEDATVGVATVGLVEKASATAAPTFTPRLGEPDGPPAGPAEG
ncbi:MAG: hypothetical protein ACFB00_04085 [Parvularculaceae bacterium]